MVQFIESASISRSRRHCDAHAASSYGRILAAAASAWRWRLAACSADTVIDSLPAGVAEPADAPARPAIRTYQYPAVHDMPPPRADQPMTDEQQDQDGTGPANSRDRQEKQIGADAGKKAAENSKKEAAGQTGQRAKTSWRQDQPVIKACRDYAGRLGEGPASF